jgi:hypothetical protein
MAIVAAGDAIIGTSSFDLLIFELAVLEALFFKTGLEESAAASATEIVGAVGLHVDEILFANDGFDHEAEVLCDRVAVAFANDLAGVLHRKLDLQIPVPVGVDFQFALANPAGVILIDVFDFEMVFEVEFFQSGPD